MSQRSKTGLVRIMALAFGSLAVVVASSCGSNAPSVSTARHLPGPPQANVAPSPTTHAAPMPVTVRVAASRYGRILVDGHGRTLYLFTHDAAGASRCAGACAQVWPPYILTSQVRVGHGAHTSLVAITRRTDGSSQLIYDRHPLYYYVGDRLPGEILCQDVEEYGGHWWVVSPAGAAITKQGSSCARPGG
jgi:predicted lipoprotein with Yx(FWY)xxD motif